MNEGSYLDHGLAAGFGPEEANDAPSTSNHGSAIDSSAGTLSFLDHYRGIDARIALRDTSHPSDRVLLRSLAGTHLDDTRRIGRYQLHGEVARGGVGIVLRAHDMDIGRDVAIKLLRNRYRSNRSLLQRFVEEAQIGGQLEHPGIVPVYDIGLHEGDPFFAMKLVQGRTLAELLKNRGTPGEELGRFLGIFEKICQTIAYAHARGVIHRDLKPSNIMVGAFGEVQVMDWGMGKVLRHGSMASSESESNDGIETIRSLAREKDGVLDSESIVGSVMGTPAYMPPEQARGEVDKMDERSDVFELGAILVEILTGEPPYTGDKEQLLAQARECDSGPAIARVMEHEVPEDLIALATECLRADLRRRPADASEVAKRIGAHLVSVESRARQATIAAAEAKVRADTAQRAQRMTLALAASLLLSAAVVVGCYLWNEHAENTRRDAAHAKLESLLQRASLAHGRALVVPGHDQQSSGRAWAEARAMSREAQLLAAEVPIGEELRDRVREFAGMLDRDEQAAARAAKQRRRNDAMRVRLDGIKLPAGHSVRDREFVKRDAWRKNLEYEDAFSSWAAGSGVAVSAIDDPKVIDLLRSSPIRTELATALEWWATELRQIGREPAATRRLQVAIAIDDDEWRQRMRTMRLRTDIDRTEVLELAAQINPENLAAATLTTFSGALVGIGERRRAIELLRDGRRVHQDFNLDVQLALLFEQSHPPIWREAARIYTAALVHRPGDVHVSYRLGIALMHLGDTAAAATALRAATAKDSGRGHVYASLCAVEHRRKRLAAAIKAGRQAVRLSPASAFAHTNLANALCSNKAMDEAVAVARHAVDLEPDYATGWCILGSICCRRHEAKEAIAASKRAIELRPEYAQAWNNLGCALPGLGKYDEGIDALRRALRSKPDYTRARNNLVRALHNRGRTDEAMTQAQILAQMFPKSANAQSRLGQYLCEAGKFESGLRLMRRGVRLDPSRAQHRYALGHALLKAGEYRAAVTEFEAAIDRQGDHAMAYFELGAALERLGEETRAQAARQRAGDIEPALRNTSPRK